MAFDDYLAERINNIMIGKKIEFYTKKMMGGLIFFINQKMCFGIHIDKKYGDSLLMAKIGEDAYKKEIDKEVCLPMDFTGRPMNGFIFITPFGFYKEDELDYWITLALKNNQTLYGPK
jgi:hypothetical protein